MLNIGDTSGGIYLISSSLFMSEVSHLGQFNCTAQHLVLPRLGRDLNTEEIEDTNQETMSSHAGSELLCHPPHHPPPNGKLIKILARINDLRKSQYFYHLLQSLNNFTPLR